MKMRLCIVFLLVAYLVVLIPFTGYMKNRPVAVKLGYLPEAEALKMVSADQKNLVAHYAIVKVLFYFGTLTEKWQHKIKLPPEYFNMFKMVETAVKLDPYNMDSYYFAQAAFTWEVGRAKDVNRILLYGTRYRDWDFNLPFYVGFNYAYFLKDYTSAAPYMKRAAELSGNPLYTTLAARYFYEAGQNRLGIILLEAMEKGAKDRNIRRVYAMRKEALLAVSSLEDGVGKFTSRYGRMPKDLSELVAGGVIAKIPDDPYGGRFYLAGDGMVRSTSKFSFGSGNK